MQGAQHTANGETTGGRFACFRARLEQALRKQAHGNRYKERKIQAPEKPKAAKERSSN